MEARELNGHYAEHSIDAIDVAEAWDLDPFLFCAIKYIQRRGRKTNGSLESDMAKAAWYIAYHLTKQKWVANHISEFLITNSPENAEKGEQVFSK